VAISLFFASCRMPAPATPTRVDPHALFTAAAQTAEALRLLRAKSTATPSETPAITTTPTLVPISPSPTGPVVATVDVPTADATNPAPDKAEFITDVTVPDGEAHGPNRPFVKTWRIQNTGETTWNTSYDLVFVSGSLMSAPASIPMPREVPAGETVDISVELVSPAEAGIYQSLWKLRNDKGQTFGVGDKATDPFWVIISVVAGLGAGTPTAGPSSGEVVTRLTIQVDPPIYSGICPKTFTFTVQFTLTKGATVTYTLESGNDQGIEMKLPPPATSNLEAGEHTIPYQLIFATSLNGWVRLRFLDPEVVVSRQVNFTLSCL
jgi:hypothetical protein